MIFYNNNIKSFYRNFQATTLEAYPLSRSLHPPGAARLCSVAAGRGPLPSPGDPAKQFVPHPFHGFEHGYTHLIRCLDFFFSAILPMTKAFSSNPASRSSTSATAISGTTATIPIPLLKVRIISFWVTLPAA